MGNYSSKSRHVESRSNCGQPFQDVISIEECKKIVSAFELSDEKVMQLRNYIIGITNSTMDIYLEEFK